MLKGVIVIGLSEKKVKGSSAAVADTLEGVEESIMDSERLQRIVESNLSPHLPGIRFKRVELAGTTPVKYAHVISVPQGSNAYQAKEKVYYGRSEYECKALHDTMIRLLMNKGRTTRATITLSYKETQIAEKQYQIIIDALPSRAAGHYPGNNNEHNRKQWIVQEKANLKKNDFDEYTFSLQLKNIGELTILECYLEIKFLFGESVSRLSEKVRPYVLCKGQTRESFHSIYSSRENAFEAEKNRKFEPEKKIYPSLSIKFPKDSFILQVPAGKTLLDFDPRLPWTLYYDNFPSNLGQINLL